MKNIKIKLYHTEFLISIKIWNTDDKNFKYLTVGRISTLIMGTIEEQIFIQPISVFSNHEIDTYNI